MKKYLNDFMGGKDASKAEVLAQRQNVFIKTIHFLRDNIGVDAFHNLSGRDDEIYVKRFHPTIFDAVSVATYHALEASPTLKVENLEQKRVELLKDQDFIKYIASRTTDVEHIKQRIHLAAKYLYNM